MEQYQNVVQDLAGNVVPQASVRVLLSDGGANATIYDSNGAQTSNPTPCDAEGYFAFQAANGKYFLQIEVAGRVYKKLGPATLYDAQDAVRIGSSPITAAPAWADVPQLESDYPATAGYSSPLNAQAFAIAKRLAFLRDNIGIANTPEFYGAKGDGDADDSNAWDMAYAVAGVNGIIRTRPNATYRLTRPQNYAGVHVFCHGGRSNLKFDMNDVSKDAVTLSSVEVAIGTAQSYYASSSLVGINIIAATPMRDGAVVAFGDYIILTDVVVRRNIGVGRFRDGFRAEPFASGKFIENLDVSRLRVIDAGRNGFSVVAPAGHVGSFVNVCGWGNLEVRGCGLEEPGIPFRFYSLNTTDPDTKISQHTFYNISELQTNSTTTNPNPDGIAATVAVGAPPVEYMNFVGASIECVPTPGTGLAINTTGMIAVKIDTCLPFGFTGSPNGFGGTGDYFVIGRGGFDKYQPPISFTATVAGGTTAGAPVLSYQLGLAEGAGRRIHFSYEMQVTNWGGATGALVIGNLPIGIKNSPFAEMDGSIVRIDQVTMGAGYTQVAMKAIPGTKTFILNKSGSGVNSTPINISDLSSNFVLRVAGSYPID